MDHPGDVDVVINYRGTLGHPALPHQ
jgi:hypothetical protein